MGLFDELFAWLDGDDEEGEEWDDDDDDDDQCLASHALRISYGQYAGLKG